MKDEELMSFIDAIYREPYSLVFNNCIRKSLKIRKKARELDIPVDVIMCVSVVTMNCLHGLPVPGPHMYTIVNGKKIDVSLDPEHELRYCPNQDKKLLFPVNISSLMRRVRHQPKTA